MGAPARNYSWPQATPGNQIARTHGAFASDVDEEAAAIVGELFDPQLVERYPAPALIGAQTWVRRRRALADIGTRGLIVTGKDGQPTAHPLLKHVSAWDSQLLKLSQLYGLDPKSDLELRRAGAEAARAGFDLDAVIARGREALEARGSS